MTDKPQQAILAMGTKGYFDLASGAEGRVPSGPAHVLAEGESPVDPRRVVEGSSRQAKLIADAT
jgi:hypothetical protein